MSPAGTVALALLRALRVSTVDEAKPIVAGWVARPRLAPGDIRDVLAELAQAGDQRGTETFGTSEFPPRGRPPRTNLDGGTP